MDSSTVEKAAVAAMVGIFRFSVLRPAPKKWAAVPCPARET